MDVNMSDEKEIQFLKNQSIMLLALTEAFKIRSDEWPQSLIDSSLKSIDSTAWVITNHIIEQSGAPSYETPEENLELIDEMINNED